MNEPLVFAHRGAPDLGAAGNTLSAFQRALTLGAGGLESDIALTADGVPVLAHVGLNLRRSPSIARSDRRDLPATVVSLTDLYERCGSEFELSLDMAVPRAADSVIETAARYGASHRLWLTYWRIPQVRVWRARWPDVHLVYPALLLRRRDVMRTMAELGHEGVDALNLHHRLCRRWTAEAAEERGLKLFVWGVRSGHTAGIMRRFGVHGMYCDNLADVLPAAQGRQFTVK